jgi:hypothetical protein
LRNPTATLAMLRSATVATAAATDAASSGVRTLPS